MGIADVLQNAAIDLIKHLNKDLDKYLPKEIAGIVNTHSKLAVGSAWIPIPGADAAAGAVNIWTMYGRINNSLGISIKENILKSVGSAVATNLASYAAMSGVGSALKLIPGIGTVAGAVISSASLYAITIASGWVYLKALTQLAKRNNGNIDMNQLGDAVKHVLKDGTIKSIIKDAKREY